MVYVHRRYEDCLGPTIALAKRCLPDDFSYDIVKYNRRTETVSFIQCSEFDAVPEPSIQEIIVVQADGTTQRRRSPKDPYVYHHKWLFVPDDYDGFDVEESKQRSQEWLALPDVDKSRIGCRSYWKTHVVPRLQKQDVRPACRDE